MFPEKRLGAFDRLAVESGREAHAFHRLDLSAGKLCRIFRLRELHARRHDVDKMCRRAHESPFLRLHSHWPVCDERGADASFMGPVFVFAERRVAQIRPRLPVADVGVRTAGYHACALTHGKAITRLLRNHVRLEVILRQRRERGLACTRLVLATAAHTLGAAAVVLQVKDERVFKLAVPL